MLPSRSGRPRAPRASSRQRFVSSRPSAVGVALDVLVEPGGRVPGDHVACPRRCAPKLGVAGDERELVVASAADVDLHRVDAGALYAGSPAFFVCGSGSRGVRRRGQPVVGRDAERRLGDRRRRAARRAGAGGHSAPGCPGGLQVVPGDDRVDARVLLADERHRARAERVAGDPDATRVDHVARAGCRRVARPAATRRSCFVAWLVPERRSSAAADRDRPASRARSRARPRCRRRTAGPACEGTPSCCVGGLAEGVRAPLSLDVVGQDHVPVLGERRGDAPVERLGRLDRARRDHDPGTLRRARLRVAQTVPEITAPLRAVKINGVHDPVAIARPSRRSGRRRRTLWRAMRADVAPVALGIGRLDLQLLGDVVDEVLLELGLERGAGEVT